METKMNIQEYMTAGVENIIRNALKVTLTILGGGKDR